MRSIKRYLTFQGLAIVLMVSAAFAIPIDHKYDKAFRYFSLTLIPEGLQLPFFFDKKIYYYPTDLIALALAIVVIFGLGIPFRRLFFQWKSCLLGAILCLALLSLTNTPFSHYPLVYIRCLQLLTSVIFFSILAHGFSIDRRKKIAHLMLGAIVAGGLFQSAVAIAQYFKQASIGLRILSELSFSSSTVVEANNPSIKVINGSRWLFDTLLSRIGPTEYLLRAVGTMPHPNVLAGFLFFSLLASYYFLQKSQNRTRYAWSAAVFLQFFALCTTYSRSGLFAFCLSLGTWFTLHLLQNRTEGFRNMFRLFWNNPRLKAALFTAVGSAALCVLLFGEQYSQRGGIINYNIQAQASDKVRFYYQDIALKMIQDRPLLGVGYQLFSVQSGPYQPNSPLCTNAVHNIYLLLASETGLISLAAFLIWIGSIATVFLRSKKDPLTITLFSVFLGFLFIGLCDFYPISFQQGRMMFFICTGLLSGLCAAAPMPALMPSLRKMKTAAPQEVIQMFDRISPTYDKVNRILSLGMDTRWRKKAVQYLPAKKNLHLLDLATGTADQLISLFESNASIESAIGLDLASEMLLIGEKKIQNKPYTKKIELQVGDAMAIPFEEGKFDACTFSFGIRNVKDPLASLQEIHRILKPEGKSLILEFSLPLFPIKAPYLFYLRRILPWLGGKMSSHPEAYRYLNQTIESFPSGDAFLSLMKQAGFSDRKAHRMAFGAVTLYIGVK